MIAVSEQASGKCDTAECQATATHGGVARGATGRYCEVLWFCKSCAARIAGGEENILTTDQAREKADKDGWADF
jgi:hypothetical protein